jgi:hypothetical protein
MINPTSDPGDHTAPFVVGWIKDSTKGFEMGL